MIRGFKFEGRDLRRIIQGMEYRLTANATFDAETLDDAFTKLANHLRDLVGAGADTPKESGFYDVDTPKFFNAGTLELTEVGHEGILREREGK